MTLAQKVSLTAQQLPIDAHDGAAGYLAGIPSLCLPDLVFNDAGAGVGDGQINTTAFPDPIVQASTWDPQLDYAFGQALGAEAHAKGIDVQLAPGIETDRIPENGRNWEYMSEDPYLSGQIGAAEVRGIQSQHVIVTLKHFIANSQETDRGASGPPVDSADLSLRTLEELYAPQYDVAIHQGGAMGVMCAYNRINSIYACQNPETLKGVLLHQFGFPGFVVSDWGATHSTVPSALNGLDIEMNVSPGTYFGAALQRAVQSGAVPMRVLDSMVLRILRAEFAVGVVNDPPAAQPAAYAADVSTPDHIALARQISEEGSVLFKNADGILPLTAADRRIALIGTDAGPAGADLVYNAEGSGRVPEFGTNPAVVSPLTALTRRAAASGDTVLYADGSSLLDAETVARTASVAIVVVGNSESEGVDEPNLSFNGDTCTLIGVCVPPTVAPDALVSAVEAANPNTIVVLDTGEPVLMPWLAGAKALLEAFYPGQQDGVALASLLYGDVDPSGHLTETWPASQAAQPIQTAAQWPGVDRPGDPLGPHSAYSEGIFVGYRWYQAHHVRPQFPFGYGLSYTTFGLSHLVVRTRRRSDAATVSLAVTNTGTRPGAEVVQLYVHDPANTGEPPEQLKGFRRVFLDPGQSQTVTLRLTPVSFAHWSDRRRTWIVTPGRYGIAVGDSSAHLPLRRTIRRRWARLSPRAY
ncbi:beta-glucosidase [Conexibacter sp. DBS9H8]|uniref:beta-glucosidase family protein n=1 Tax=Conexibacter sp. DBS9H8 TaxID=2937801 RepID=UPI00200CAF75|nr:glycoside hydrolase family 3 C-terminal domain-containing protein [Conexibacter sp. DBS9H8]